MESPHAFLVVAVYTSRREILYRGVDLVIVVRIVLKSCYLVCKSVSECLSERHITLMSIERTIGIRCIQVPSDISAVGNHIDNTAYCIRSESHRHHTLIYLDPTGETHRDIIQTEGRTAPLLGHSVDKHLYMLAA